jgi:pimeloyl-ACP methyl ester carboxylesterase
MDHPGASEGDIGEGGIGEDVKAAIETREVVTLSAGGICLRGTHHKPKDPTGDSTPGSGEKDTGLLIVTGLADPRAGCGDCAVHWADGLAECGYRCFRVDLPGLGDSDGEVARTEADFMFSINSGFFSDSVCGITDQLMERFRLREMLIIGHCSGAVTAIYSAAANKRIAGLILLDPYFHLQESEVKKDSLLNWHWRIIGKLVGNASARAFAVKLHSSVRNFYRRRMKALENPNLPLIHSWNQLTARRLPILILRSPTSLPKQGEPDFIGDLQRPSNHDCSISIKLVQGATHDFATRDAREAVVGYAQEWLSAFVSLQGKKSGSETSSRQQSSRPSSPFSADAR